MPSDDPHMILTLIDPQSGHTVYIKRAELSQRCDHCGYQLQGEWALAVEGRNWVCLSHHPREILSLEMSDEFRAKAVVKHELQTMQSGDPITLSPTVYLALGMRAQ